MKSNAPDLPKIPLADDSLEVRGSLERVVFHNAENGYTVFRLKTEPDAGADNANNTNNTDDLLTVIGHMNGPQPGASLVVRGHYVQHPKFGRQLSMESCEEQRPASAEGIRHFLASGCIRGIGTRWAQRIVDRFGTETLRILDEDPGQLLQIPRFGQKRLAQVQASWGEHQGIRELMIFLQTHGIGQAYAGRIFRMYGPEALAVVQDNPYRLAMDIHGIGFTMADGLAMKMGIPLDSALRAEAGLLYILMRQNDEGHIYYPKTQLLELASVQLGIDIACLETALTRQQSEERLVVEDLGDDFGVYLSRQHHYESRIAYYVQRLLRSPKSVFFANSRATVKEVLARLPIELAPEQRDAVFTSADSKVMVLTGGPGTGKTTILNAIIQVFKEVNAKILLAAPTGRAAKRMAETCKVEAKTIHRLLEYSPKEDGFARNENNPLACGLLVVDEASMMDTMLMYHLVKAAPLGTTFLLVGDINQLPSVGPGNVLRDLIASGVVPVVELMEVFRQAATSDIICNAHRINQGEMPYFHTGKHSKSDFFFIRESDPEKVANVVVDLVRTRLPRHYGFHPQEDIQVLSPMLKGSAGVNNLNQRLQNALNPQSVLLKRGDREFRLGDKVMQIRNNYDKDIFNGDMGIIILLDTEERELTVRFDERNVPYSMEELDEIVPAYAISIHKSQGGEYPVVVIPLLMQHYVLLQRNLVYTAVTRGRKLVVLVGETKALAMAVANNRIRHRYTWLAHRLAAGGDTLRLDMLPQSKAESEAEAESVSDTVTQYMFDDLPEYLDADFSEDIENAESSEF